MVIPLGFAVSHIVVQGQRLLGKDEDEKTTSILIVT
jgi:hypothetical protein